MTVSTIKIGFDLDGVLLENPARMFRPITHAVKSLLKKSHNHSTHFYYPRSPIEQLIWRVVHWSSFKIAEGYEDIKTLKNRNAELYIVTSRYNCLKDDFQNWLKKMNANTYFKGTYFNKENLQPHVFKSQEINRLKLDFFVEDNWDIVRHINKTTKAQTVWITNVLDSKIEYDLKCGSLKKAVAFIDNEIHRRS